MNWSNTPSLRALIPFLLGICTSLDYYWYFIPCGFLLLHLKFNSILKFLSQKGVQGFLLFLFFFIAGFSTIQQRLSIAQDSPKYKFNSTFRVSSPHRKTNRYSFGKVELLHKSKKIQVYARIKTDSILQINQLYSGKIQLQNIPFNSKKRNGFQNYLLSNRIFHQGTINQLIRLDTNSSKNKLELLRESFSTQLDKSLINLEITSVVKAMTLGMKTELSKDTAKIFAQSGSAHILAVSGMHLGIVFLILQLILKKLKSFPKLYHPLLILALFIIWIYASLTGLSISVIRASFMLSIYLISLLLNRNSNPFNTIFFSALALLIYEPLWILHVGFQLSFLAVLGILTLYPVFLQLWTPKWKIVKWGWQLSLISLSAQLSTAPIIILHFEAFPVYGLLSNFITAPGTVLILYLTYLSFLTSNKIELLPFFLEKVTEILMFCLKLITEFPMPYPTISIQHWEVWLYYLILTFTYLFFLRGRKIRLWQAFSMWLFYSLYKLLIELIT